MHSSLSSLYKQNTKNSNYYHQFYIFLLLHSLHTKGVEMSTHLYYMYVYVCSVIISNCIINQSVYHFSITENALFIKLVKVSHFSKAQLLHDCYR